MLGRNHGLAAIGPCRAHPPIARRILRQLLKAMPHQNAVAFGHDGIARGIPHHARAKPRIAECFQQRFVFHPVIGRFVQAKRALQAVKHCTAQAKPLDPLSCPICGHFIARHAPYFFGIGFEEYREQLVTELVDGPILETLHIAVGKCLGLDIARHAQSRTPDAQIEQSLKRAQRIAVKFALIINPAHPWALNKIVRQYLIPKVYDFF